ncbi:MAG TPA: hypothetical protein VEX13_09695 [Chloroflexia bacterium]|nr:hypothetical protein [Chloroflexia bacterium]
MSSTTSTEVTWRDPLGSEAGQWRGELWLPSIFLVAAALILSVIVPIHVDFQPRPVESAMATLLAGGVMVWGVLKHRVPIMLAGAGLLVLLMALGLGTQPVQLGVPLASVWPLRVGLLLLVTFAWAFLMGPPLWARRALTAITIPLAAMLVLTGWPALSTQLSNVVALPATFSPYWLTVDGRGTLYAGNADGNSIMVFDRTGAPIGTLWPYAAPQVGVRGPGIRPIGYPTPLAAAVPTPSALGLAPAAFTFCGLATGPGDFLYVVDPLDSNLLKFDKEGNIAARRPLPDLFEGARGCIAVDDDYIYLASRFGTISILDHDGKVLREVRLSYQPFGISPDWKGNLLVMGFNMVNRVEAATGHLVSISLPTGGGQIQSGYQAMVVRRNGEMVATDLVGRQLVRIDLAGQTLLGTIGGPGALPGQFQSMGGLAEDRDGNIYVADWQPGVVHRFTPEGRIDATLSAPWQRVVQTAGEEDE